MDYKNKKVATSIKTPTVSCVVSLSLNSFSLLGRLTMVRAIQQTRDFNVHLCKAATTMMMRMMENLSCAFHSNAIFLLLYLFKISRSEFPKLFSHYMNCDFFLSLLSCTRHSWFCSTEIAEGRCNSSETDF